MSGYVGANNNIIFYAFFYIVFIMKKLNLFQQFNFNAWQTGKQFMIQSIKYNEKKGCVSLDVIITEDQTDYGDASVSNIFEKFKVHCC